MEFVLEFLLEVFFEIFGEGFIALSSAFVPQKAVSKKGKKIIGYVFLSISLALIACLFVGMKLIKNMQRRINYGF